MGVDSLKKEGFEGLLNYCNPVYQMDNRIDNDRRAIDDKSQDSP